MFEAAHLKSALEELGTELEDEIGKATGTTGEANPAVSVKSDVLTIVQDILTRLAGKL
jgi:hypothetical protein